MPKVHPDPDFAIPIWSHSAIWSHGAMKMSPFGMGWLVKYFRPRLIVDGIHLYGDLVELSAVHPPPVIAATVRSDTVKHSEAFMESQIKSIVLGFRTHRSAIELSILADCYGREIAAYDIQTTRCDLYGQEKKYSERVMLIYDELHYDALAISPFEGAPVEFDQILVPVRKDRIIGLAEELVLKLVKEQQRKRRYSDTANFTLRCEEAVEPIRPCHDVNFTNIDDIATMHQK
ncbi:hypothetical protein CUMW_193940 [Citrus unshiu]|uniref:Ubiquitin thioesterase OTU n=1 Tax=Citrus unshiu TaxID=55188 RepID=A0A2H5Q3Y0_CITUN|nr:hypothetical protein CUMW_193940 [Citrus unshiu]